MDFPASRFNKLDSFASRFRDLMDFAMYALMTPFDKLKLLYAFPPQKLLPCSALYSDLIGLLADTLWALSYHLNLFSHGLD